MEKVKYSIIACAYGNPNQFKNFLRTIFCQNWEGWPYEYEFIISDNANPNKKIFSNLIEMEQWSAFINSEYIKIPPEQKKCKNISQGINLAAQKASGENLVIIADPCVLLSLNLLSQIDKTMAGKVLISGAGTDLKISPQGTYDSEYQAGDPAAISKYNEDLLKRMGWPDDPLKLSLIPGTWRIPDPHNHFDVYVAAMPKSYFEPLPESGGWGDYWAKWLEDICNRRGFERLSGIRIIHQYHRVWKGEDLK